MPGSRPIRLDGRRSHRGDSDGIGGSAWISSNSRYSSIRSTTNSNRRAQRPARLVELGQRWVPWWSRLPPERLAQALDDTGFFVPYVRELLFPETGLVQTTDPELPGLDASRVAGKSAAEIARAVPDGAVVRLTLCEPLLAELKTPKLSLVLTGDGGAPDGDLRRTVLRRLDRRGPFPAGGRLRDDQDALAREVFETSRLRSPPG